MDLHSLIGAILVGFIRDFEVVVTKRRERIDTLAGLVILKSRMW